MEQKCFHISIFLLIFLTFADNAESWRIFWRGRRNHGFLGDPSKQLSSELPSEDLWFEQQLDHFDPTNDATWMQRYYINDKFYKPGGPIFIMIGGEGEATAKWMHQGAWIKYAKDFNALCFQLEHRYYGKSHPTSDISTKNLVYLSSEQALSDLAFFIKSMNQKYKIPESSKWIAFGGSYPGSLAAWAREKYPHLVHGSISSSGPLLAKVDFQEYYEVVKNSLGSYSDNCVDSVSKAMAQVEILLKHMIGQRSLNEKFKLCDPIEKSIDNNLDLANFIETLASNFAGVVQYNKDNSPHNSVTIDEVCEIMSNTTIGPPINRLAEVNEILLKSVKQDCLDYKYDKMIAEIRNTSWESEQASGMRQWTYQTCTEFGFYQTSNNKSDVFGDRFPVNFFIQQCKDIFSERFNSTFLEGAVARTNTYYGALNPDTTNVLYVHGSIDPWHALGLTSSHVNMPAIYIEGTAHCANMYEPSDKDPSELVEARKKIESYLGYLIENDSRA